jgi:regulator of replication initiation timing
MPALKLKQLQYESDTWKRMLGFMMDENIHLKNRLSEVLKENFDNKLLEDVEHFQSRFVKEDELIGLLRNEVAELDKFLDDGIFNDGIIIKKVDKKLKNLRQNIITAELDFGNLKLAFNNYLSENM